MLAHAGARTLEIGCRQEARSGVPGLSAYVCGDGRGFDASAPAGGMGVGNMRARALHGRLDCVSGGGDGTRIDLWLPYDRGEAGAAP